LEPAKYMFKLHQNLKLKNTKIDYIALTSTIAYTSTTTFTRL